MPELTRFDFGPLLEKLGPLPSPDPRQRLQRLVSLPKTSELERRLAVFDDARQQASASATDRQYLARLDERLAVTRQDLELARERDAVLAARPSGCWCYGLGGRGECALWPTADDDPAESWLEYCCCPDGRAERQSAGERLARGRAAMVQRRLDALWGGGLPTRLAECSLETYPVSSATAPVVAKLREWLTSDCWLLLYGPPGRGKTGLVVAAVRELWMQRPISHENRHRSFLFLSVPNLLDKIRGTYGRRNDAEHPSEDDLLESLARADLLVLDDLGAEQATDWATGKLYRVINDRYDASRRTVITTNLELQDMPAHLTERTTGRLTEKAGPYVLRLDGPNLRLPGASP